MIELLACLGLMWILKYGTILDTPRNIIKSKSKFLTELLNCSLCLGFWCGVLITLPLCLYSFTIQYLLLPLASSAVCWSLDSVVELIHVATNKIEKL